MRLINFLCIAQMTKTGTTNNASNSRAVVSTDPMVRMLAMMENQQRQNAK